MFDNVPAELRTIFFDLVQMALGVTPQSLQMGYPSAAACYPSQYAQYVTRHVASAKQWERFFFVVFNNECFVFETHMIQRALAQFSFKELRCERVFLDESCYEVEYESIR